MRKTLVLTVGLCLLYVASAPLLAADSNRQPKLAFRAPVVSVDQASKTFVVHPSNDPDITLKVTDKTQFCAYDAPSAGRTCAPGKSWADLKAGVKVEGWYKNDGSFTCLKVTFLESN